MALSYEIGTNWADFADKTANVIGPFFTYEVLNPFFLEAGFVGVMLFGMTRVWRKFHFFACCVLALGAVFSAFWILAANSCMPDAGGLRHRIQRYVEVTSWCQAMFTPSLPYRLVRDDRDVFEPAPVRRGPGGLDRHRDRAAAVCRLWPAAHRRSSGPLAAQTVSATLLLFICVYLLLHAVFFFYATRLVLRGPETAPTAPAALRPGLDSAPARAGSAAP